MPPVLVTNDDGIDAPGILALVEALAGLDVDLVVAAPLDDRSGSGAAIGGFDADRGVRFERRSLPGLPGVAAFGVDGPPALAVLAARLGGFGPPPDLVVSGVNPGCNTGRSVLHSGTVGAALTSANLGGSGLAVSIDAGDDLHWETAAHLAAELLPWLQQAPAKTVLNVNVPNRPVAELRGVRRASLAPFGTVRASLLDTGEGHLQMELTASGADLDAGSDTAVVQAGFVAVTALVGIRAAAEPVPPSGTAADPVAWLERRLAGGTANIA